MEHASSVAYARLRRMHRIRNEADPYNGTTTLLDFFGPVDNVAIFMQRVYGLAAVFASLAIVSALVNYISVGHHSLADADFDDVSCSQMAGWYVTGEHQLYRIRKNFYRAILRQNIAWFDEKSSGALLSEMNE